jgi:hypothetical protein
MPAFDRMRIARAVQTDIGIAHLRVSQVPLVPRLFQRNPDHPSKAHSSTVMCL